MKFLSVCSGIECASVAWSPLGWEPVAFSEIDPFASAVLAHHYPNVPNLGDMTKFHEWTLPAFSLLVGGTPCQAFSVAGLRAGLADPRGNLTLTFLALAGKYRPRWLLWENVPGVLSDRTNAFGHFLAGLAELGYGWAYRVFDAQYGGVPQRRRRVFVVGCLGDWRGAAEVFFERESLRGDSPPRRQKKESAAPGVAGCLGGSSQSGGFRTTDLDGTGAFIPEVADCLQERDWKGPDSKTKTGHLIPADVAPTLRSGGNKTGGDQEAVIHVHMAVRRLTPMECERLMGFPDLYTMIPRGKKTALQCPDGPRYKVLGNSMVVPEIRWIGRRIATVNEERFSV